MTRKSIVHIIFGLILVGLLPFFAACAPEPAIPSAPASATLVDGTAEATGPAAVVPLAFITGESPAPPVTPTAAPADAGGDSGAAGVAAAVASRTPVPTTTPSSVDRRIEQLTSATGLAGTSFLGLSADDWINLAISILIALGGYYLGTRLLIRALKWGVRRTQIKSDDALVDNIIPELRWFATLFFAHFAIVRLDFLSDGLRTALDDLFFTLGLVIAMIACLKLIGFAAQAYEANLRSQNGQASSDKLDPVILSVQRLADLFVLIVATSIGLSHFGIGASAMAAMVIVIGLAITFGAQNVIGDAISGFVILVDQPFRIGDAILLKEPDTWGNVLQIGARTTRILMADNREVIIPNSTISESQLVNYSYPDASYRVQSDIRIAYDTDVGRVRKIITDALRAIDGVLPDKPVDVFFLEFLDSARSVRVRWWIDTYENEYPMLDQGNAVIESSLLEASIRMPYQTYDLNIKEETGVMKPSGQPHSAAGTSS